MCDMKHRLKSIAKRDGNGCYICGGEVDISLRGMVDEYGRPQRDLVDIMPTLDHVIPRSKGGINAITNLRLTHHKCNNDRGNDEVIFHIMKHLFLLAYPIV